MIPLLALLPLAVSALSDSWHSGNPRLGGGSWGRGPPAAQCTSPAIRKEWRTLSTAEQQNLFSAVQCMFNSPGVGSDVFPAIGHHYDSFIANHINASLQLLTGTGGIHQTGVFLPWHRYFISIWEKTLQTQCGLQGSIPYWDWTLDAANITASPLLQPDAWGSNGAFIQNQTGGPSDLGSHTSPVIPGGTGGGCISDGPFANVTLHVGTGTNLNASNPRCLSRNFNPSHAAANLNATDVALVMSQSNFTTFRAALDPINTFSTVPPTVFGVHGNGHLAVGAELFDILSSPSEPLFYLHHAWLDSLWTNWQEQDTAARLSDIAGPTIPNTVDNGTTTLDTMMWMAEFFPPSFPIREVMDTQNRNGTQRVPLCYKYDNTP